MANPLHVAFVWHMHQPYYKDDRTSAFLLPWVRLRAAKDYLRLAAILDGYPAIRQTFNLVPSLLDQLEDYAAGGASDVYLDLSRRPVAYLTPEERLFVVRWMREPSQTRRVRRYPRYLELLQRRERLQAGGPADLAQLFSDAELRDLQVWFNLSWIDPATIQADPVLSELVRRERDFAEEDKEPILRKQVELLGGVVAKYRELRERGQVELITSPAYHPILPLITNVESARVSNPHVRLPGQPFAHPEDARAQLEIAVASHRRRFGAAPRGLWPPENAIGEEIASLASAAGLQWVLSDEGVLARSLDLTIDRDGEGRLQRPDLIYTPYRFERDGSGVDIVFRDARLSNLIGFEYQHSPADQAAADLVARLHAIAERQSPTGTPALVTIALDGENCWDFYEENGNPFLHRLYERLSRDESLRVGTVSEFLESTTERRPLARVQAGSWINAGLETWIGDPEQNRAWELLSRTRQALDSVPLSGDGQHIQTARREAFISEGSDWFWWLSRSHDSGIDLLWDNLFRLHLRNVYAALDQPPPLDLFQPIVRATDPPASKRPERKISPKLNGAVDESEWKAGGYVDVSALFGAMHPPSGLVRRLWFGHDDRHLFLRFDLLRRPVPDDVMGLDVFLSASAANRGAVASADLDQEKPADGAQQFGFDPAYRLSARPTQDGWDLALHRAHGGRVVRRPVWQGTAPTGDALELALPFAVLAHEAGEQLDMAAVVQQAGTPPEHLPPSGSIQVRVPGDVFRGGRSQPMKILVVSAEVAPFAKVGGLADVAGALPKALRALGHDVRVVMPRYGSIDPERYKLRTVIQGLPVPLAQQTIPADVLEGRIGEDVPIYFIDCAQFFSRDAMYGEWDDDARFIYFSRAALEMVRAIDFHPDVIHVNDWHTAVIPNMLARLYERDPFYSDIATALTIHNLAFQGVFGYGALHLANLDPWGLITPGIAGLDDIVNLLGRGLYFCDVVNTVSTRYAEEILTPEYGERMDPLLRLFRHKLYGIINGIDYEVFNAAQDPNLVARYDAETLDRKVENKLALQQEVGLPQDPAVPVVGLISRLYDQKGLDLIANIMWGLMRLKLQVVVLGAGDARYEEMFRTSARENPKKLSATIGFKPVLAQHIYAGSDMFLMPSRFEPCGLGQLISLRYGTIPIVRATGGLADTIEDWDPVKESGNGFVFEAYDHWDLYAQVVRATEYFRQPDRWRRLQRNAMATDVSWTNSAKQYERLYQTAIANHADAREYATATAGPYSW